jgi:rhamnosyltransferase
MIEAEQVAPSVFGVVVTFKPIREPLDELMRMLLTQVAHIVVVDNSPIDNIVVEDLLREINSCDVTLIRLGDNYGVAKGLNVGIDHARTKGADFVLLSDQDSLPAADMVAGLLESYRRVSCKGSCVAAVGPVFTDLHTGTTFPFQVNIPGRFFYGHAEANAAHPEIEVLTLITSGTLIPLRAFEAVGPMLEELFIDKVDLEWCLRARAQGFSLYGTSRARMFQRLGENRLRVWYMRWRDESAYSPTRVYYQVRNFFALCRLNYIPMRWKLRQAWFTFGVAYSQIAFGYQRAAAAKMAFRGVLDGLFGRMGALDL